MRALVQDRTMQTSRNHRAASFGIDMESQAHLAMVLRDSIYSDKILAVLREYGSNAWDAHREVGKDDLPIEIHIPTAMKPELIIRDHGPGMSHYMVFYRYTQYGASGKRDTDRQVGFLGLGCKSGFAYNDSFTVTSWHKGEKRIYLAVLDDSDMGQMQLLYAAMYGEFARAYLTQFSNGSGPPSLVDELEDGVLIKSEQVFSACPEDSGYWANGYQDYIANWSPDPRFEDDEPLPFLQWVEEDFWGWASTCELEPPETGIEIKLAVKASDVWSFQDKAQSLYRYYVPQPRININLADPPNLVPGGFLNENDQGRWIGVMGCNSYKIDMHQIQKDLDREGLWPLLQKIGGGIFFGIGDVQFNASREELKYSDSTKARIVEGLKLVVDQYIESMLACLQGDTMSSWEKRKKAVFMAEDLGFQIPDEYAPWLAKTVKLWGRTKEGLPVGPDQPKLFTLISGSDSRTPRQGVEVNSEAKIYIRDNDRNLKGYPYLKAHHVIAVPTEAARRDGAFDLEGVQSEIEKYLEAADLAGFPIGKLSDMYWDEVYVPEKSGRAKWAQAKNPKHSKRTFVFNPEDHTWFGSPFSEYWKAENRVPEDTDVFVVLDRFESYGYGKDNFYNLFKEDRGLAATLGLKMPPVYGYKTTTKKPVEPEDCTGTYYYDWRLKFFGDFLTQHHYKVLACENWLREAPYNVRAGHTQLRRLVGELCRGLGQSHPATRFYAQVMRSQEFLESKGDRFRDSTYELFRVAKAFCLVSGQPTPKVPDNVRATKSRSAVADLDPKYPLLKVARTNMLEALSGPERKYWIEYIRLVDANRKSGDNQ